MPINITGSYKFKKSRRKPAAPLLPGDAVLLRQIEQEQVKKKESKVQAQLEDLGPAKLEWQKTKAPSNILGLISAIIERMWTEIPEKMSETKSRQISVARSTVPPLIMISHLYGIYAHNTTLVDRTLAVCSAQVCVLDVNIPNINEMVIARAKLESPLANLINSNPENRWFSKEELKGKDIPQLIAGGYLTMDPSKPGVYSIAIPRQGAVIKLVLSGRKWLVKTLNAQKWKELPEEQLEERLEKGSGYWKDLKGISLEWILYDAVGCGLVYAFETPIGRGWKLS